MAQQSVLSTFGRRLLRFRNILFRLNVCMSSNKDVPGIVQKNQSTEDCWQSLTDPSVGKCLQFSGIWVKLYGGYQTTET